MISFGKQYAIEQSRIKTDDEIYAEWVQRCVEGAKWEDAWEVAGWNISQDKAYLNVVQDGKIQNVAEIHPVSEKYPDFFLCDRKEKMEILYENWNEGEAKLIERLTTWTERQMGWVNVYKITRRYGGPEESGWYYDWWCCVKSVQINCTKAQKIVEKIKKEYMDHGDIYSVLGGEKYQILIEPEKAQSASTEIPVYQ